MFPDNSSVLSLQKLLVRPRSCRTAMITPPWASPFRSLQMTSKPRESGKISLLYFLSDSQVSVPSMTSGLVVLASRFVCFAHSGN